MTEQPKTNSLGWAEKDLVDFVETKSMSISSKFRRLISLYKLLWAPDRLDALEAQLRQVKEELDAINRRAGAASAELQSQIDEARRDTSGLGDTMYQLAAGVGSQLKILGEDLNVLKSSLEVPQEMVNDFLTWKAENPIPAHPLVTVIVATYNHEKYVREAIDSVIMQKTDFDFEIVAFAGFNFDVAPFIMAAL